MKKLTDFFTALSDKVAGNTIIGILSKSFSRLLPITVAGAIAALLNIIFCNTSVGLAHFESLAFLADLSPLFTTINAACMNFMALILAFYFGKNTGMEYGQNADLTGILAIVVFILVCPNSVVSGDVTVTNVLSSTYSGARGIFTAMFVCILAVYFYCKLASNEKLKIKMPASVPTGVADSFSALLPVAIVVLTAGIANYVFIKITGMYIPDVIYKLVQQPLTNVISSPYGSSVLIFVSSFFWFFGVHGGQVISPIIMSAIYATTAENAAIEAAGGVVTNYVNQAFWATFANIGGSGNTIALLVVILLMSKREDYKQIAKLSFAPGLFGTNEPVVFGLPIVLNPFMFIPFILSSVSSVAIGYIACSTGFLHMTNIIVPWQIPVIAMGLTCGGWKGLLVQTLCLVVSAIIYIPFVKMEETAYFKKQATETNE